MYQLAEQFRVNRHTVSAVLERHGMARRRRSLSAEEIAIGAQLYNEGCSLAKIGKRLITEAGTVHDALRKVGISMRPVGTNQWTGTRARD